MREENWSDESPNVQQAADPHRHNLDPRLGGGHIRRSFLPLAATVERGWVQKEDECEVKHVDVNALFHPTRQLHGYKAAGKAKCDVKLRVGVRDGSGLR